jgi:hypothetical protein
MSLLPSQTNCSLVDSFFLLAGTENPVANISSLVTDQIVLDGQTLDATSAGGGTLLINGIAVASAQTLTSSISNWAQFPALSTIVASGGGGGVVMNTGSFSTLAGKALSVSSINGANALASVGVSRAMTTAHSVSDSTGTAPAQTLVFVNDNAVPLAAGQWYLVSAIITTTVNVSLAAALDNWYFQCGASGGGTFSVNNPSTVYWAQAVGVYNQAGSTRQNQYTFTQMVRCSTAIGAITLNVVATLPGQVGSPGNYQWNCSNFDISPLGGQLN